jgi:hypothetical protein
MGKKSSSKKSTAVQPAVSIEEIRLLYFPGNASPKEEADDYRRIVLMAAQGTWRIAVCRNEMQYLLQTRGPSKRADAWKSQSFVREPAVLPRLLREKKLEATAGELLKIANLPDMRMVGLS